MSTYEQVYKAFADLQKNKFWDAWGIVASPRTIYELREECMERMSLYNTAPGALEEIFGLVVIPYNAVEDSKMYIVDEQLGRIILRRSKGE